MLQLSKHLNPQDESLQISDCQLQDAKHTHASAFELNAHEITRKVNAWFMAIIDIP